MMVDQLALGDGLGKRHLWLLAVIAIQARKKERYESMTGVERARECERVRKNRLE